MFDTGDMYHVFSMQVLLIATTNPDGNSSMTLSQQGLKQVLKNNLTSRRKEFQKRVSMHSMFYNYYVNLNPCFARCTNTEQKF